MASFICVRSAPQFSPCGMNISTRSCIVSCCLMHNMRNASSEYASDQVANLSQSESHHTACSRCCWGVELAIRSGSDGIIILEQEKLALGAPEKLVGLSTLPVLEKILPPVFEYKSTVVVKAPVASTLVAPLPVFKLPNFAMTEYEGAGFCTHQLA